MKKRLYKVDNKRFSPGDYVFASKYSDADRQDRWRVDTIAKIERFPNGRVGILFEETGEIAYYFARKITQEEGQEILTTS